MVNQVQLLGYISDIKTIETKSGKSMVKFTCATSRKVNDKYEYTYHDCIAFNELADNIIKHQPEKAFIDGEIEHYKKDGVKHINIICHKVSFV